MFHLRVTIREELLALLLALSTMLLQRCAFCGCGFVFILRAIVNWSRHHCHHSVDVPLNISPLIFLVPSSCCTPPLDDGMSILLERLSIMFLILFDGV